MTLIEAHRPFVGVGDVNEEEPDKKDGGWDQLSIGSDGAGLPFHSHGVTWMAVVYGVKRSYSAVF